MSCDFDHDGFAETCYCDCGCDNIIHHLSDGICFACYHGEHAHDGDLILDLDDDQE